MARSISYDEAGGKSGSVRRGGMNALRHNKSLNPSPREQGFHHLFSGLIECCSRGPGYLQR
jgi:hypothetical protein